MLCLAMPLHLVPLFEGLGVDVILETKNLVRDMVGGSLVNNRACNPPLIGSVRTHHWLPMPITAAPPLANPLVVKGPMFPQ